MSYPFDQAHLQPLGFTGFRPLRNAADGTCAPAASGVYAVLLDPPEAAFIEQSVGGHFKRKDPTVKVAALMAKWLTGTPTMYIGRANNLRSRIKLLARYGRGEPVPHQGGRYMWQLASHRALTVAWRLEDDPVSAESSILEEFEHAFGRLPFANLVRGARAVAFA